MITVLIADDHHIVRDGLRRLLTASGDIAVVGEVANGDDVLPALRRAPAQVVLLDISMPGIGFLELLRLIGEQHPKTRVLVLSAHAEEDYAARALRAGAAGYVAKEKSPAELVAAVRKAHAGGRYVSATLAERLAADLMAGERPAHDTLSDREYQVLQLLGAGKSVKEIAAGLTLSPKTVSTYRTRLLEKLQLKTTADLIRYAVQHNLAG
jgi:DNA-binding NarL/FixJ family response regulator